MTELLRQYLEANTKVQHRIEEISKIMKGNINSEELKNLRRRKEILQQEKYELSSTISEIIHSLESKEKVV